MIEYIRGAVTALNPTAVTLETGSGVAFMLNISLPTFSSIEGQPEVRLYVHEHIREDAWVLYGFADTTEREHFRSLIGVSGVGASTAMLILSALQGEELAAVISSGDVKRLKSIKGIGTKTAERIIVDLHDKIKVADDTLSIKVPVSSAVPEAFEEALAALQMLGFDRKASQKTLTALFDADPTLKVETAIKRALSMM